MASIRFTVTISLPYLAGDSLTLVQVPAGTCILFSKGRRSADRPGTFLGEPAGNPDAGAVETGGCAAGHADRRDRQSEAARTIAFVPAADYRNRQSIGGHGACLN